MVNSYSYYVGKLQGEYREVFQKICDYAEASSMDDVKREEMLSAVMDNFLEAQSENKSVKQALGCDIETFCNQLCSEIGIKSRIIKAMEAVIPIFIMCTWRALGILFKAISDMIEGKDVDLIKYRCDFDIFSFLIGALVVVAIFCGISVWSRKYLFKKPTFSKRLKWIVVCVVFVICMAVVIFLPDEPENKGTYLYIVLIVNAAFWLIYALLTIKNRQYRKENRISLIDRVDNVSIEKMEVHRFEYRNKVMATKGLSEITFEQFLDLEEKDCNKWNKKLAFYVVLALVGVVGTFIWAFPFGGLGFSDAYLAFLSVIVVLLIVGIFMWLVWHSYKYESEVTKRRLSWIKLKREELKKEAVTPDE